jgi:isoleucyl-tRNA synthetase
MITDQQGKAMHKSAGNSVEPDEIINKYGADILRLWVSFTDYSDDVRLSNEILEGPIDSYRKIRNTIRYALGNLHDYNPTLHKPAPQDLAELDKYLLNRLDDLIKSVTEDYREFRFRKAVRSITDFCILDLSSLMLDASKDRLYTLGASSAARRSAQATLSEVVITILKLLAPVLSFTTEEAWQEIKKLPVGKDLEESILLSSFPLGVSTRFGQEIDDKWNKIREIRAVVLKSLEEARQKGLIGSSLEAKVIFNSADAKEKEFLKQTLPLWPEVAIVSQVELAAENGKEKLDVTVEHAKGAKCPRCWQWKEDIGQNPHYDDLCGRCATVLEKENVTV